MGQKNLLHAAHVGQLLCKADQRHTVSKVVETLHVDALGREHLVGPFEQSLRLVSGRRGTRTETAKERINRRSCSAGGTSSPLLSCLLGEGDDNDKDKDKDKEVDTRATEGKRNGMEWNGV